LLLVYFLTTHRSLLISSRRHDMQCCGITRIGERAPRDSRAAVDQVARVLAEVDADAVLHHLASSSASAPRNDAPAIAAAQDAEPTDNSDVASVR
jgi:hypothetical protein